MVNVLVTATGGGVGQSIIKALNLSKYDCNIISTDINPLSPGLYRGNKSYLVPSADSNNFVDKIIYICNKEKIDLIFIGSDPEVPVFADNKQRIEQCSDAKVVVSDSDIINICRNKWETYLFLKRNNLPYTFSALPEDVDGLVNDVGFPLVVKPVVGSASYNVYLARNKKELDVFIDRIDNPIIQEHLEPVEEEYTSSIVMFDKEILGVITMKRELKCGNTYRAFVDDFDSVRDEVIKVGKKIDPFGPCNIQMRHTDRGPITFEVNLRFSGTTALRAYAGFNEVEAVIDYLLFDKKTHLKYNKGVVMRYWNEVYTNFSLYEKLINDREIEKPESNIIDYF